MILVTLGTQDKQFVRLLDAIQKQIDLGNIKEEVVVQAGYTKYESKDMKIFEFIPMEEFDDLIRTCDVLITHGGVGSIITGLKNNKKVIAAARLSKYKEHYNDHQLQIIENFSNDGYILSLDNLDKLDKVLKQIDSFKPKKYISNTKNISSNVTDYIDSNKSSLKIFRNLLWVIISIILIVLIIAFVG